jgi:hypothetical protein
MDNLSAGGGTPSPEDALRQLIEMRMQLGKTRFDTIARQMGMPDELLDHIEETVGETGGAAPAASGLLDASGRPLSSASGGLVDISGRPLGAPTLDGSAALNGNEELGDADLLDGEEVELDEESSRRLFQELVGVRMIIGPENFGTLATQMGMPSEASEMVETAAGQVEDEISTRYPDQDEAMTVRLVNARMMMGPERFADLAGQVGMPSEVVEQVEDIAGQIDSEGGADDGDEDADDDPSLA